MRSIRKRQTLKASGVDLVFVEETVAPVADWSFTSPEHVLIVHRAGQLRSLATEFENGLSARTLPDVGDIWAAPGGQRYSACAKDGDVAYCEVRLGRSALMRGEMPPRIAHSDRFLHTLVEKAASLIGGDDDLTALLVGSIAETVRLHVARAYFNEIENSRSRKARLTGDETRRLRAAVEDNLDGRHTAASLARVVGLSEDDFFAAFKSAFGATPHQFLLARRLARARELLRDTRISLTEIAMRTGFSTPSHFSATFRARVGVAPREYRRQAR